MGKKLNRACAVVAVTLSISVAAPAGAAVLYTVNDLGTLGGRSSYAFGINATGRVTGHSGRSDLATHAFATTTGGAMTDLGTLGADLSYGHGINAAGQVAGDSNYRPDSINTHAFVTTVGGVMTDLGTLGGRDSYGYGINDAGQVTGFSLLSGNTTSRAFVTTVGGAMTDLGTLGGTSSYGFGINAAGQVAGYSQTAGNLAEHAFVATAGGGMIDLGGLGGSNSYGYGINDAGQVTGYSGAHAFVATAGGGMTDLGTLGGTFSLGYGINNAGQAVGFSRTSGDLVDHAFVATVGGGMIDLNTVIAPLSGWTLSYAQAINSRGQIAVTGIGFGVAHAFLLTPIGSGAVPEPSVWAMLLLGFGGIGVTLRARRRIAAAGLTSATNRACRGAAPPSSIGRKPGLTAGLTRAQGPCRRSLNAGARLSLLPARGLRPTQFRYEVLVS